MKKILLLIAFSIGLISFTDAQKQVTGKVTDAKDGTPLNGASVKLKGSSKGTLTDANGEFKISVPQNAVLVISNIGYADQEVNVGNQTSLNVTLSQGENVMNEVVVTAVGIKRSEKALGYSITKVDPDNLIQKSEPDILKGLQGKVAGVDIRTSQGTPGAATRISIRGNSSFYGNNEPLIIVDGVPYNNDQVTTSNQTSGGGAYQNGLSQLDPNDIATMNILKGSSAAALYGSRASNGVIIITTKSGSAGRSKKGLEISYLSSVSFETINNLPDYQNDFGNGTYFNYQNANGSWGPRFGTIDSIPVWPDYKAAFPDLFTDSVPFRAYPNNVKNLFRTGMVYENSITLNGGDEKTSVSATASSLKHDGYVPNSFYKRYNMSLGGSTRLGIGVNVRGNFSYANTDQKGSIFGENQVDGASSSFARTLFLGRGWDLSLPYEDANGFPVSTNKANYDNPNWDFKHNTVGTKTDRYTAGLHTDYAVNSWIHLDYQIGVNVNTLKRQEIIDIGSRAADKKGRITEQDYRHQEVESNFLITVTPNVGNKFYLKAIAGHNVNERTTNSQIEHGNEIVAAGIYNLANTKSVAIDQSYYEQRRLWGIFGDVTFGYNNDAFVEVTGRNDWSSTLPKENRSYFYPSVSGSFVFSDAFKLKSNSFDYGKLRAGWAKVGRDADPYNLQNVFVVGQPFLGQPTATTSVTSGNPNLKPEFTTETEIGTQLSFLHSRITLDAAVYSKISTSQIAPITLPPSSGYTATIKNYGKISNKGIEIDLGLVPVRLKNFSWNINGTFSKNKSTVKELIAGVDRILLNGVLTGINPYLEAGKPFGYLRGSVDARDSLGNLLVDPTTGFLIRATEEAEIGDPNPDFKAGLSNTFTYKGFYLNVLFDMTKGGDLYSETLYSLLGRGVTKDTRDREGSWIIPGYYGDPNTGKPILDANKNEIPNATQMPLLDIFFGESFAINSASEWNVYDATVYHLREVTLGYDLPKKWFQKTPVGSISLSVSGRNLWHFAPNIPRYTNFDPEVNSFGSTTTQGIEFSAAPTTRRIGINLKVTF